MATLARSADVPGKMEPCNGDSYYDHNTFIWKVSVEGGDFLFELDPLVVCPHELHNFNGVKYHAQSEYKEDSESTNPDGLQDSWE